MSQNPSSAALEVPLPRQRELSLVLVLIRRMAANGLSDSRATMLALDVAGARFRSLLVYARCFVIELSRSSNRKIMLAPCCASGMTRDEALLIDVIESGDLASYAALTDDSQCLTAHSAARALKVELQSLAMRKGWRG